jgi:hypothetical protein
MSHRLPVNGNRCNSYNNTLLRRKTQPGNSIPVTASVTTLFHNRHAEYRKYTESQRLSTTAHPPYVTSTSAQRQSMILIHRQPSEAEYLNRKEYFSSPQAFQHLSINATLNTGNTQKDGVFPPPLTHRMSGRLPVYGNR